VKRGMLLLLALSARQPVVMREVLRDLDAFLRSARPAPELDMALTEVIARRLRIHGSEEHAAAIDHLAMILDSPEDFPPSVKLKMIELDNLRLVRSFSFVGETVEEFEILTDAMERSDDAGSAPAPTAS